MNANVTLNRREADTTTTSSEQQRDALRRANVVRRRRKELKLELADLGGAAARERCVELLSAPPPEAVSMAVGKLVGACPGVGASRLRRYLMVAGVRPFAAIGDLTERQRAALAAMLTTTGGR